MKKKYIYLIALFILELTACNSKLGNNEQANSSPEKTQTIENNQKNQKIEQDHKVIVKSTAKNDITETVEPRDIINTTKDSVYKDSIANDTVDISNQNSYNQNDEIQPVSSENNTVISFLDNLNWIDYSLFIIIFTALVVIICYLCIKLFGHNNELEYLEHEINKLDKKVDAIQRQLSQTEQSRSSTMSFLESSEIRNLKSNIISLKQQVLEIGNYISNSSKVKPHNSASNDNNNPGVQTQNKFFIGRPSNNCEFDDSKRKLSASEETYYTFYLDSSNPNKATFDFTPFDTTRMYKAIDNRASTIEFACDVVDYVSNPSKCIAVCGGTAHLENERWIIDKKAQVKYV